MASEKIKITRKELEEMYDIEEERLPAISGKDEDEVTITETFGEFTERKDKENKWLSE